MSELSFQEFLEACGAAGGFTLRTVHTESGQEVRKSFDLPFAVVGRSPFADLNLNDPRVSWRHAYLQVIAGRVLCVDLQSRTGVLWGDRAEKSGWLEADQVVRVGPFRLELAHAPRVAAAITSDSRKLLTRSEDEEGWPRVTLEFGDAVSPNKRSLRTWQLDRALTFVGQSAECKVRLADANVSGFHCSLLRTRQGVWVIDLLSKSGTFLNGNRLRWAAVGHGDELRVGDFLIRFHYGPARSAAPAHATAAPASAPPAPANAQPAPPHAASGEATRRESMPAGSATLVPVGPKGKTENVPPPEQEIPLDPDKAAEAYVNSVATSPFASHTDFWKAIVTPLFGQFAEMQQHMFDQFQNTLMMVVQMLNTQQKAQFDLFRDEMDRLRALNGELAVLQAELKRHPTPEAHPHAPAERTPPPSTPTAAAPPAPQPAEPTIVPFPTEADTPPSAAPEPELGATAPPAGPKRSAAGPGGKTQRPPEEVHRLLAERLKGKSTDEAPEPDVHRLIAERVRALQAEQLSIWQKIMRKLTG